TETIALSDATKPGYTFGGWYTTVAGETTETKVTEIAKGTTGDLVLTAKWAADGYSITYSGVEGATNPNTVTSYTIETETIALSDATKPGYTFGGWYTTVAGETAETKVTEIAKGTTGDITLTAKWTANTDTKYTVKYLQQNIDDDDYTEVKEDRTELTGTTGEMTKATLKSYEGFYSRVLEEAIEQKEISGDGSTVIEIFYDRQTIINYYMIPTLGATASNIIEREGRYGATIEAVTAPTNEGYTFKEWVWRDENEETHTIDNLPTTFDVEDKTFVAVYTKDETSAGVTVTLESITSDDEGIVSLKVEETAIKATVASGYSVYTWRIDDENYEFEDLTLDFSKVTLESEVQPAAVSGAHNIMLIVVNNNDESDYYSATVVFTVTKE
ncbi:MAG: InlB B-repeat-containing protein, partial [Treponema sp.]|nr:InlB B-repeat-containing protein [Treponema sp.]